MTPTIAPTRVDERQDEIAAVLRAWCEAHADKVKACYLSPPDDEGHFVAHFNGWKTPYDYELSSQISDWTINFWDEHGLSVCAHLVGNFTEVELTQLYDLRHSTRIFGE